MWADGGSERVTHGEEERLAESGRIKLWPGKTLSPSTSACFLNLLPLLNSPPPHRTLSPRPYFPSQRPCAQGEDLQGVRRASRGNLVVMLTMMLTKTPDGGGKSEERRRGEDVREKRVREKKKVKMYSPLAGSHQP